MPDATNEWQSTKHADLSIRRYQSSDRPAVWRLHRAGLQQMAADLGAGPWDADLDDIEAAYLDGGEFLVGVRGDEVVAMGALRRVTAETADVKRLRVREELQGRGVGEAIARALEQRARELCFRRLTADTTAKQVPAQRLLGKVGFHEVARRDVRGLEVIYYERELS